MRGSIICSWPWWTDPLTPPLPMKLMKNLLQRALMHGQGDEDSIIMDAGDRKGSRRGQWTRSFSFLKIWLVHFRAFCILIQNNFSYLVSHILRFWGILVSWGQNSGYIGIRLPPLAGPGELASCVSVVFLGFLWTNSISLSFKAGPSRTWKFRVSCFLLYQLMITLPFEHLNCFVFPPGVSHFPCNFKTFSTNFFRDSKSFIHTNFPSLRWRYSSSQDSGSSEEDSVSLTWRASASELQIEHPSAMLAHGKPWRATRQ